METKKPALLWLQKATIGIIFFLLMVVYVFQGYQFFDSRIVKARLQERELILNIVGERSDSLKQIIIHNQKIILDNQDSIIKLLKKH